MLVRVEDVVVTDPNPHAPYDFDEFTVSRQLDPDDALRVGSLLYPALGNDFPVGTGFAFLQGVLLELDGYKLEPRSARDLSER